MGAITNEIAVSVTNVSKDFRLPSEKYSSLKSHIAHPFKRRSYQHQHALHDIDLQIKKGEFFGIVGRNGSGKSTLLKMIAGIYQPTKGKIAVSGKLVPFIELGVGFNPELTGRENVYLNGALLGFSEKEIDAQYDDIVSFAELDRFMGQKLKNYSSGMQVRLAFSMAVRAKADVLLIDEVLAVGDADFQRKCFDYFKRLKKEKVTVIFVSHNMEAVREYCDRAMLIEKSKVVDTGSTNDVAERYLKLFTDNAPAKTESTSKSTERWGDGGVQVTKINVEVSNQEIVLTEAFIAQEDIDDPIPGFRVRDAIGRDITGTNTRLEHQPTGSYKKGEHGSATWRFTNAFGEGEYVVDAAILRSDGITTCDWWNNAAQFSIKKGRHLAYLMDPGFETIVERPKK